jgi:hypothetical protein
VARVSDGTIQVEGWLLLLMLSPVAMLFLGIGLYGERVLQPPIATLLGLVGLSCSLFVGYSLAGTVTNHWLLRPMLTIAFGSVILACYVMVAMFGGCAAACAVGVGR